MDSIEIWLMTISCATIIALIWLALITKILKYVDDDRNKDFANLMKLLDTFEHRMKLLQGLVTDCDDIIAKEITKLKEGLAEHQETLNNLFDGLQKEKLLNIACREVVRGLIGDDKGDKSKDEKGKK